MDRKFEERKERTFLGKQIFRFKRGNFYGAMVKAILLVTLNIGVFNISQYLPFKISNIILAIISIPFVVVGVWFIGYLDDKLGLFSAQTHHGSKLNPKWKQLFEEINEIEKRINKLEK